jgi:hypothetical protein
MLRINEESIAKEVSSMNVKGKFAIGRLRLRREMLEEMSHRKTEELG